MLDVPLLGARGDEGDVDLCEAVSRLGLRGLEGSTGEAVPPDAVQVLAARGRILPDAIAVRPPRRVDVTVVTGDALGGGAEPAPRPSTWLAVVEADTATFLGGVAGGLGDGGRQRRGRGRLYEEAVGEGLEEGEVVLDGEGVELALDDPDADGDTYEEDDGAADGVTESGGLRLRKVDRRVAVDEEEEDGAEDEPVKDPPDEVDDEEGDPEDDEEDEQRD
mmetsp:Transcript_16106/g.48449  ORF Transcript_16106/g.48449 Transcript_16106/m.48449 type:complete len:220 (+) Transcript_16106:541-1200(+)